MMNEVQNRADVIFNFLRKRQRVSDEARNSLPHRIVKTFDMICKSGFLSDGFMPLNRNNRFICFPKICKTNGALSVNRRHAVPQSLGSDSASVTDVNTENFAGISVNRQPNPLLVVFVSNKRPHLVALQDQAIFFFDRNWTSRATCSYLALT